MSHARARLRPLLAVAVSGALAVGCHDLHVYPFEGQRYDAANQCLAPEAVIDLVEGYAHGTCQGVRCFKAQDGTEYVSPNCEAAPHFVDVTSDPNDATCMSALQAYARGKDGACPTG